MFFVAILVVSFQLFQYFKYFVKNLSKVTWTEILFETPQDESYYKMTTLTNFI